MSLVLVYVYVKGKEAYLMHKLHKIYYGNEVHTYPCQLLMYSSYLILIFKTFISKYLLFTVKKHLNNSVNKKHSPAKLSKIKQIIYVALICLIFLKVINQCNIHVIVMNAKPHKQH